MKTSPIVLLFTATGLAIAHLGFSQSIPAVPAVFPSAFSKKTTLHPTSFPANPVVGFGYYHYTSAVFPNHADERNTPPEHPSAPEHATDFTNFVDKTSPGSRIAASFDNPAFFVTSGGTGFLPETQWSPRQRQYKLLRYAGLVGVGVMRRANVRSAYSWSSAPEATLSQPTTNPRRETKSPR